MVVTCMKGDRKIWTLFWVSVFPAKIWGFSYNKNEEKNGYLG